MPRRDSSYILIDRALRTLHLRLSYRASEEEGWRFAECPELRMVDQGRTESEALENLKHMILTTLIAAIETENLESYLEALAFKQAKLSVLEET